METIKQVLGEFLRQQRALLKPRTFRGCEEVLSLFEDYLNGYAYQYLNDKDSGFFDKLYDENNKEFCEVFGIDKIGSSEVGEFLGHFIVGR
jgi:succinate dehydrogenase flavin-adding protein (antitoxin of CptAB toxin-antitoxin module)